MVGKGKGAMMISDQLAAAIGIGLVLVVMLGWWMILPEDDQ